MLFNSIDFILFLPIVFIIYWFFLKKNIKAQNLLILISSYIFYGWWDWRFLSLIFFSSIIDFSIGKLLSQTDREKKRKLLLITSILVNIGLLGFFKYFNFFIDNFIRVLQVAGISAHSRTLNIILPVGISFYTFQTLSYTIDIYKKKISPTKDIIAFMAFVSFFPQLVAGPIERAKNLLPQFFSKRVFSAKIAENGCRQILWGFFKKLVIADNCGIYVDNIFDGYEHMSGLTLVLGAILFGLQIYGDFSGYSDIAIGTARLFGFDLMQNFAFPYFSRDIAEFWRRWHISLTTWFRDYIYIPLGGSRGNVTNQIRNTFIIFLVSGFWHGANWTFIIWGGVHAMLFVPLVLMKKNRKNFNIVAKNKLFPSAREFFKVLTTFILVSIAWVFFRADNLNVAFAYLFRMQGWIFVNPLEAFKIISNPVLYSIIFMFVMEWLNRSKKFGLEIANYPYLLRWIMYLAIILVIFLYGNFNKTEFIYFAF